MKTAKLFLLFMLFSFYGLNTYSLNVNTINITSPNVPKYHKYEIGLNLNKDFTNPYDPEIISIEAHFISPSGKQYLVYGFYYQPFSRLDIDSLRTGITPLYSSNFWRQGSTDYPWRIRFSPNEVGNWQYFVNIIEPNTEPYSTSLNDFECIDSDKPGFIQTSLNRRYLEFSDGQSFFGKGEDQRATTSSVNMFAGWPNNLCNGVAQCYSKGTVLKNLKMMWNLANSGGNFIRLWLEPYSYDIEWERINDYTNRQGIMSDFDILIDEAFDNNVYIHLVLLNEQVFRQEPNFPNTADWNYNPYKNQNVSLPLAFFSNLDAKNKFKSRLRYIHSRWGYSTSIASYSLMNEPEFVKDQNKQGSPDYYTIVNSHFKDWQIEMSDFLKNNSYPKHLISCDYAFHFENIIESTNSIDFTNTHIYGWDKNIEYQRAYIAKRNTIIYNKPFNITESGFNAGNCQFSIWYYQDFHNILWSSVFHGSYSNSMYFGSETKYQHYIWGGDYIKKYKALNNFLVNETFNTYPDYYKPISNALNSYNFYKDQDLKNCPPPDVPIIDRAGFTPPKSSLGNNGSPTTQLFNPDYLGNDITTNFEDKLQVFALRKNKKIIGWVQLKDAYWYNVIHGIASFSNNCYTDPITDNNPSCSPQNNTTLTEADFNSRTTDATNIELIDTAYITINNMECRGKYSVHWFSTHENFSIDGDDKGEDGGEITQFYDEIIVDDSRTAVIKVPKLQFFTYSDQTIGEPFAEDYGFKLTLMDLEGNDDNKWRHSYADAYNNEEHFVDGEFTSDMNGHIFYRDNNGNMSQFYWLDKFQDYDKTTLSFENSHKIKQTSKIQVNEQDHVFYIGEDNSLHFYNWNGNTWSHNFMNDYLNVKLTGNFNVTQNSHIHFRRSSTNSTLDGNLDHYYWDGTQYQFVNKTSLPNNYKVAIESPIMVNSRNDVFYKNVSGELQYFHWNGSIWVHKILHGVVALSKQYVDGEINTFEDKIVYRMPSGYLGLIYWNATVQDYRYVNLPSTKISFVADENTDIAITSNDEIFYKGKDGLMHYYYNGTSWVHAYAESLSSNLQVDGTISTDNFGKVYYATNYTNNRNYGHLGHFWNISQNTFVQSGLGNWWEYPDDFKVSMNSSPIVINNRGHVFYKGNDGRMQYYYWKNFCDDNVNRNNSRNKSNSIFKSVGNAEESYILKCFPNPFVDNLIIDIISKNYNPEFADIKLIDILGSVKYQDRNMKIVNNKLSLDLSGVEAGVYFLHFSTEGNKTEVFKIVKINH